MSTFESSSSFLAPVAAAQTSTRANGLRKTHNHRALRINTDGIRTPVYNARPYFFDASEVVDSDEEEEHILVHLMPVPETLENTTTTTTEENTIHNAYTSHYICIQLPFVDSICDAFHRAKKTIGGAGSGAVQRRIVSAITLLAIFFTLVMFGGSVATTSSSASNHHLGAFAPSGRASMRIAPLWAPPQANDDILEAVNIDTPPATVVRAARAPSYTNVPVAKRAELPPQQPREVVPLSPSQFARGVSAPAADVVVRAPSGTASAKFRLLYVYGEEEKPQEHGHPDDLADLFNGGRL